MANKTEASKVSQHLGPLFSLANTPINKNKLEIALQKYPNKIAAHKILQGLRDGFPLQYTGPRMPCESPNLKSARENIALCRVKIQKEIDAGRVSGPFPQPPLSTL